MNSYQEKKIRIRVMAASVGAAVFIIAFTVLLVYFKVDTVDVSGNTQYTDDEIREMVLSRVPADNSILLYIYYHNRSITDIPFIEKMDVRIVSPSEVAVQVYEKAIAGYVKYLGRYMYFDRDGIIVESATEPLPQIPYVTGLKFDECVMYEPLPVGSSDVFAKILSITQLLEKYEIEADRIYFDENSDMTLYFGNARVMIGSLDYIDEKMMGLKEIVPKLAGLSGVLHMEDFKADSNASMITFEKD